MSRPGFVSHGVMSSLTEVIEPAIRTAKAFGNELAPTENPGISEMIEATLSGWMTDDELTQAARPIGVAIDTTWGTEPVLDDPLYGNYKQMWNRIYFAHQELPTQAEYREIGNRQFWSNEQFATGLRQYKYIDPQIVKDVTNLRFDIPGPSDLVRFSVRHIWEPELIKKLTYDEEFPGGIIDIWHAMKGLDYSLFTGPFASQVAQYAGAPPVGGSWEDYYALYDVAEPTWAKAYWWSHWVLPSPTQGYQMWQRLNPDRDPKWDAPEMKGVNFSYDDLSLLLRANDYPPRYRGLLAAISRPVPGIRFAREFATTGVYNLSDLYSWAARQGYGPQDSRDIATDVWAKAQNQKNKNTSCAGCKLALEAYSTGVIDRTSAVELLVSYGVEQDQAEQQVDLADLGSQVKRAKEVVSAVRRQYLTGGLDDIAARQALLNYGLVMSRIDQYIEDWTVERQFKFREISAGKLVSWACKGLISGDDLDRRLATLGYDGPARSGLVAEAAYCAAQLAARAAAQIARAEQQQKRAALEAQKQAAAAYKALAQMLAGRATPKDLRKWYCEGLITAQEVHQRLTYLSWPDGDITRLISDCKSGKSTTTGGQGG